MTRYLRYLRYYRIGAAVLCLVAAVFLLLFAVDARDWGKRMAADDLRFSSSPDSTSLWHPTEVAPFGLARSVLGINDDVQYREATRLFRLGRPLENLTARQFESLRAQAQVALSAVEANGNDLVRRAQAANMLGVLDLSLAVRDSTLATTFLGDAIGNFRDAMALDDSNTDARFNLEYALYELRSSEDQLPKGTERPGQPGGKPGLAQPGRGY
jgi:hypothetical protein